GQAGRRQRQTKKRRDEITPFQPAAPMLSARRTRAAVAQLVEHVIRNDGVGGSSRFSGTSSSDSSTFDRGRTPGWQKTEQDQRSRWNTLAFMGLMNNGLPVGNGTQIVSAPNKVPVQRQPKPRSSQL